MKNVVLLLFIFVFACNSKESAQNGQHFEEITKIEGDLTREGVENPVRTGIKSKPIYSTIKVPQHFNSLNAFNNSKKVQQLISEGMLQYDTIKTENYKYVGYEFYLDIKFDNFKKYQTDILSKRVATYRMEFDSLLSVKEVPQFNMAEALISFKRTNNGTPFKILDTITPETKDFSLLLEKEIDGWVYGGNEKFELK